MDRVEEIMRICRDALEESGYEVYGYSEAYEKFVVRADDGDVIVDFEQED